MGIDAEGLRREAALTAAIQLQGWLEGRLAYFATADVFDSPIEERLFVAIVSSSSGRGHSIWLHRERKSAALREGKYKWILDRGSAVPTASTHRVSQFGEENGFQLTYGVQGHLRIYPQCHFGDYRFDFYVTLEGLEHDLTGVAIECDGHNFHERTKEQAARDRKRDRIVQRNDISVLRFTGSEIHRDPLDCGEEVIDFLSRSVGL